MKQFYTCLIGIVLLFAFFVSCNGQRSGVIPRCTWNDVGKKFPDYLSCENYYECEEGKKNAVNKHCATTMSNPPQQLIFDGLRLVLSI